MILLIFISINILPSLPIKFIYCFIILFLIFNRIIRIYLLLKVVFLYLNIENRTNYHLIIKNYTILLFSYLLRFNFFNFILLQSESPFEVLQL